MHWHSHSHHRRRMGPIGHFVRSSLRRKLFLWFASAILLTTCAVALAMAVLSQGQQSTWHQDYENGQRWVGKQFAARWDNPAEREAFARETARDLQVDLELVDRAGQPLLAVGNACAAHTVDAPVIRDGQLLGTVRACFANHRPFRPERGVLVVLIIVGVLWAASGAIARRLARPLDELAAVVKRIGGGDLKARAERSCRSQDEIGVVAEAVNEMAARIEKQLTDQRELLAAVSHELRTPLARMRLVSEIARDGGATPKTFDDLDREVVEMDALVGELLANARVDFGLLQVRELSARDAAVFALERAGLPLELLSVDGAESVRADPTLLARALGNLIDNAKKHGGAVDRFVVRRPDPAHVLFEVHDRGPGIPADALTRVFEPFERAGEKKAEGLGLGLNLVKRIAEAHQGTAFALNRAEGGATVGICLPVA
ncbi:MAG: sensor histidine kinase [Myxococcaceae bacterium]|nr:sensor histidine kinase [Myxococcaceae bacterium]